MRWRVLLLGLLCLVITLVAAQGAPSPDQTGAHQQQEQPKDNKANHKERSEAFSAAVADNVLNKIRDGLEAHNERLMLSAFDADKMEGYVDFRDQIDALFNRYESFRLYFHVIESATEDAKGVVLAEIQIEETPRGASLPIRKRTQMRFELEHSRKGWKIVDFRPQNFFT